MSHEHKLVMWILIALAGLLLFTTGLQQRQINGLTEAAKIQTDINNSISEYMRVHRKSHEQ
jgi:hypothetical protein